MEHFAINVSKSTVEETIKTYVAILAPLGIKEMVRLSGEMTGGKLVVGLGDKKPFFWLAGADDKSTDGVHIAFQAGNRKQVDEFHAAAMEAGLKCNGPPGLRVHYHPNYYAAFVFDKVGNNIEAVFQEPVE